MSKSFIQMLPVPTTDPNITALASSKLERFVPSNLATTFTLGNTPLPDFTSVYKNGLLLDPGGTPAYSILGKVVTLGRGRQWNRHLPSPLLLPRYPSMTAPNFSSSPSGGQAGTGSTGYGTLTNRWRNGVIDSGNQAGTQEGNAGQSRSGLLDILNQDPQ